MVMDKTEQPVVGVTDQTPAQDTLASVWIDFIESAMAQGYSVGDCYEALRQYTANKEVQGGGAE
jgi:hypothetical protein